MACPVVHLVQGELGDDVGRGGGAGNCQLILTFTLSSFVISFPVTVPIANLASWTRDFGRGPRRCRRLMPAPVKLKRNPPLRRQYPQRRVALLRQRRVPSG